MILGVNVDHVATVREARRDKEPDPLRAAELALQSGAEGITVHLREDRRHIQDRDVRRIRKAVSGELNLEMAATEEMIKIAFAVRPDLVTLVPEKRAELTTEGGLDLSRQRQKLQRTVKRIQAKGIPVSLFINPVLSDVRRSKDIGARMIEIHTGLYANAKGKRKTAELMRVKRAVEEGLKLNLLVNAGHGLNCENVAEIAAIRGLRGLYIGHSIVAQSIYAGMEKAVRDIKKLIREGQKKGRAR